MKILAESLALADAVQALNRPGGVVLAPTETVYGLICARADAEAVERIYELKRRPASKQLANFVPDLAAVENAVSAPVPENAKKFVRAFCPGPITLVIPDGKGGTYGFRIPDHPFILGLLRACGKILASTSANLSGEPPAHDVGQALSSLDGEPDLAVDGGPIDEASRPSTVVMVNADGSWKILRPGPVSAEQLEHAAHASLSSTGSEGKRI